VITPRYVNNTGSRSGQVRERGRRKDVPNNNRITQSNIRLLKSSESNSQWFTQRSLFESHVIGQFMEPSCWMGVISGEGTVVGWC
jgi:hypothetical protein